MESNSFEEALSNIEAFCRVLADKISGVRKTCTRPEPIANLLRRKVEVEVCENDVEGREPLVDIFEDEKQVKILVLVKPPSKSKILLDVHAESAEIIIGGYLRMRLPVKAIDVSKIYVNSSGQAFEVIIEKAQPPVSVPKISSEKYVIL